MRTMPPTTPFARMLTRTADSIARVRSLSLNRLRTDGSVEHCTSLLQRSLRPPHRHRFGVVRAGCRNGRSGILQSDP